MTEIISSFALLIVTVAVILLTRRRGLAVQIGVEVTLVGVLGAFLIAHGTSPLPRDGAFPAGIIGAWFRALAVIWWLIAARLVVNLTLLAHGRDPRSRDARLFSELVAAVIYVTAALIILNSVLDLPVNGVLATSGVIAIVLGLALQSTLADVFAGIAVGLEKPFHLGDRVSLGSGVEGIIIRISWRSITIQTDGDDLVTMPNSIVAKGQIINRSVPTSRRAATVTITAPPTAPTEIILELMRQAALLCSDVMEKPAPSFTVERSGLLSSAYAARFYVPDTPTMIATRSAMLRQIRRLLYHAGIGRAQPLSDKELLIFEALYEDEIAKLAGGLIPRRIDPGDVIFQQGSTGTSIYIVQAGVLETVREDSSLSTVLGRIGAGEYIGELGLIIGVPRGVTITALTHGRVLELPGDSLTDLLQSNIALNTAMERSVRRGLALLDRDVAARSAQPDAAGPDLYARIKAFFRL